MKAIIKSIWIDSATTTLEEYVPDDRADFSLRVNFRAGIENEVGADDFQLFVCTPDWIKSSFIKNSEMWGRNTLIVQEYDLDLIREKISQKVENFSGSDWQTIAAQISRFALWEFDEYQP